MSLTLELEPKEESALRSLAERTGRNLEGVVRDALCGHVPGFSLPEQDEKALLLELSAGLPEEVWRRYEDLRLKLESEVITEIERREFLEINREVEAWNVRRLSLVAKIARLRGISVDEAFDILGQSRSQP